MKLLHQLGGMLASPKGDDWGGSACVCIRELSIGLCRGNALLYRAGVGDLTCVSATHFQAGLDVPTDCLISWGSLFFACAACFLCLGVVKDEWFSAEPRFVGIDCLVPVCVFVTIICADAQTHWHFQPRSRAQSNSLQACNRHTCHAQPCTQPCKGTPTPQAHPFV
jgi:hypothetical protein